MFTFFEEFASKKKFFFFFGLHLILTAFMPIAEQNETFSLNLEKKKRKKNDIFETNFLFF
jgi:hypothetical protein